MSNHSRNMVYNHLIAEGESKLLGLPTRSKVLKQITSATKSFIHGVKVPGSNDLQHYNFKKQSDKGLGWSIICMGFYRNHVAGLLTSPKHRN
ncbi:hypothetical protein TNIN_499361 [Trichonephila inaurata madagascariensis]|uniref:Uncharacterized protein n=1 Tax=Trichonephila inaurata madagascariensis TaxID=2747483 RepID=A0A8X6WVM2_9ARAC|nr:hypothetical protein TNIN_499361 [Trichonephila inaurata madagascariensis]